MSAAFHYSNVAFTEHLLYDLTTFRDFPEKDQMNRAQFIDNLLSQPVIGKQIVAKFLDRDRRIIVANPQICRLDTTQSHIGTAHQRQHRFQAAIVWVTNRYDDGINAAFGNEILIHQMQPQRMLEHRCVACLIQGLKFFAQKIKCIKIFYFKTMPVGHDISPHVRRLSHHLVSAQKLGEKPSDCVSECFPPADRKKERALGLTKAKRPWGKENMAADTPYWLVHARETPGHHRLCCSICANLPYQAIVGTSV
ncbi:hypothetical protein [Cohaesibacter intestini]|uniref:hypothetical protein n=1 Tax=Cohaesibacter intestini TaxID=2211145 RepID=UPI00130096D9|nr:hypothetical protein [Cohaesibacter intestini]